MQDDNWQGIIIGFLQAGSRPYLTVIQTGRKSFECSKMQQNNNSHYIRVYHALYYMYVDKDIVQQLASQQQHSLKAKFTTTQLELHPLTYMNMLLTINIIDASGCGSNNLAFPPKYSLLLYRDLLTLYHQKRPVCYFLLSYHNFPYSV